MFHALWLISTVTNFPWLTLAIILCLFLSVFYINSNLSVYGKDGTGINLEALEAGYKAKDCMGNIYLTCILSFYFSFVFTTVIIIHKIFNATKYCSTLYCSVMLPFTQNTHVSMLK